MKNDYAGPFMNHIFLTFGRLPQRMATFDRYQPAHYKHLNSIREYKIWPATQPQFESMEFE
jgi:hypothetical protein